MLSIPHLIIVFVVALVVFGPEKLPELARNVGKLMGEFRKATGDLRSTFEGHLRDLEKEADLRRASNEPASNTIATPAPVSESPTPSYSAYTASPEAAQAEISTAVGAAGTVPTTPAHLGIGTPVTPPPVSPVNETPADPEAVAFFSAVNGADSSASSAPPAEAAAPTEAAAPSTAQHDSITLDPPHTPESLTDARTRPA
jgi:sec-independent protein translocase protein TatB